MISESLLPSSDMWVVRAERGGIFAEYFLSKGVVTIGWGEVGPILDADSSADILGRCAAAYPWDSNGGHRIRRFVREMEIGDAVVTYDNDNRMYHVGMICSRAEHGALVHGGQHSGYVRQVEWKYQVSRDLLSPDARNRLGSLLTLFRVRHATSQELRTLCMGWGDISAPSDEPDEDNSDSFGDDVLDSNDLFSEYIAKSDQFVEDAIAKLGPFQIQDLMAGILRAMGYRTTVSKPGPDRGVDIFASPDGLGLKEPRIFVEVKHRAGAMGPQDIRTFTGGRNSSDRCLYLSTGGFTKEARYEAERARMPLTLLTLPDLRELLVSFYESLDPATRALVPLRNVYWPVTELG